MTKGKKGPKRPIGKRKPRQSIVPITWNDMKRHMEKQKDAEKKFDGTRRGQVRALAEYTGRPALLYASDFLGKGAGIPQTSINLGDKEGFREICHDIEGPNIDVVIHSPGGEIEAAESIVKLLRRRFDNVRFFVPNIAKSAATMMALSANEIWMDPDAELGPIDPQLVIRTSGGIRVTAAQAIIDQFDSMTEKIKNDPGSLPVYIPILQTFAPALYQQAENALELAKNLVSEWLKRYMFHEDNDGADKARCVAEYLGDHNNFRSHSRGVTLEDFRSIDALKTVRVRNLADEPELFNRVRAIELAVSHTFNGTTALKVYDNSENRGMAISLQARKTDPKPKK